MYSGQAHWLLLLVLSVGIPSPARSQSVEEDEAKKCLMLSSVDEKIVRTRSLQVNIYYDAAEKCVHSILADPRANAGQLSQAHMQAGMIAAVKDQIEQARTHFLSVLRLNPRARLPPGTSPKIRKQFETIRDRYQRTHLDQPTVDADPVPDASLDADEPPPPPTTQRRMVAKVRPGLLPVPRTIQPVDPSADDSLALEPGAPPPSLTDPKRHGHALLYAGVSLAAIGATTAAVSTGALLYDARSRIAPMFIASAVSGGIAMTLGVVMIVLGW